MTKIQYKLLMQLIYYSTRAICNAIYSVRPDATMATRDDYHMRSKSFLDIANEITEKSLEGN